MIPSPSTWEASGRSLRLGPHRIFYALRGHGDVPLVLVHGYPTSSWDFAHVEGALGDRFRLIAPDMLGFGFSSKPRGHRYRITEQADVVRAVIDEVGVASGFHLLCHDYGDTVGQELLARHEEGLLPGLRSVVFLNGGLFPETHRPRPAQRLLATPLGPYLARGLSRGSFDRTLRGVFGPSTQPDDALLADFYALAIRDHGREALGRLIGYMAERRAHRTRWVTPIERTRLPMRVIDGVLDPVSGAHMVDRLLVLRPDADVVRLPVGHYPQVEAPAEVAAAVHAFHDAHA